MGVMTETPPGERGSSEPGLAFRPEIISNNGDALEKMGVVDPEDRSLLGRLFDLVL